MRRTIAVVVLLGAAHATPAPASAPATCSLHRGYSVVTESPKAVISVRTIRREDGEGTVEETKRFRGCWRSTGREGPIATGELVTGAGLYDEVSHEGFVLSGGFVAWVTSSNDKYFNSLGEIRVWNLVIRRQAHYAFLSNLGSSGLLQSFVLSPRGGLAFILADVRSSSLWTLTRRIPGLVDEGAAGAIAGLTRTGRSIGWTNAGNPQTAVFE